MTLINKLFNFLSTSVVVVLIGLVLLVSYWQLYPYKVVEFKTSPYPILNPNKEVQKGGRLIYEVDTCKYMDMSPDLTKYFVDGVIYETSKSYGALEMGCSINKIDVYVPQAIPAGVYKMKFVERYKVNPIRTIEYVNYSETFTVVEKVK